MLVSIDWIKDFVNLNDLEAKELVNRFTLSSAEIEGVETSNAHLKNMWVAEIIHIEKHPNADSLNLVTFKIGESETRKVVCGAKNVKIGLKTAYAPVGTVLPGGFELVPKEIRGILSEGMLCSESELGLSEESDGIMEFDSKSQVGMRLDKHFNETPDTILDIDNKSLTHRPDLWGHYGMAREFAAIFERELKNPFNSEWEGKIETHFNNQKPSVLVKVDSDSACLGYFGLTIEGITVNESPQWIQKRLKAVGLRPINSIVDISNYVMLETGGPNHIFDRNKISGDNVFIKRSKKNQKFTTLDENEREILPHDTVISDDKNTLVLAGIMGGLNSGVSLETKSIFLEVANWKAAEVRKTSTRLGLRTDSSQRFEKSLDSQLMKKTLYRLVELILELNPKATIIGQPQYDGPSLEHQKLEIQISLEKINKTLGVQLDSSKVKSILHHLSFEVSGESEFKILVPSFRSTKDIEYGEDIIEEIGRIIGYDNIVPTSPGLETRPTKLTNASILHRKIRNDLVYNGQCFEVMTYPLIGNALLKKADWPFKHQLKLINALSNDHELMRDSLIPSLIDAAGKNSKNYHEFQMFELGRVYGPSDKNYNTEGNHLGIVFYNREKNVFLNLINTVERLLSASNIPADITGKNSKFKNLVVNEDWAGVHPFEFQNLRIMGKLMGALFSIHPNVLSSYKMRGHLSMAIIDLSSFEHSALKDKIKYTPIPKFPGSTFDCTVVSEKSMEVADVLSVEKKVKLKELQSLKVLDLFPLENNKKAITLRAVFLDPEKTIDGERLQVVQKTLINGLEAAGFPLKK